MARSDLKTRMTSLRGLPATFDSGDGFTDRSLAQCARRRPACSRPRAARQLADIGAGVPSRAHIRPPRGCSRCFVGWLVGLLLATSTFPRPPYRRLLLPHIPPFVPRPFHPRPLLSILLLTLPPPPSSSPSWPSSSSCPSHNERGSLPSSVNVCWRAFPAPCASPPWTTVARCPSTLHVRHP